MDSVFIPELHKSSDQLPIYQYRDALLYMIENNPVTVVMGQTGSGKTTQIPVFLYHAGWSDEGKVIAITQPRKLAVSSTSIRVAAELGSEIGQTVGYAVRFEDVTSAHTRIKFVTDGLLLREARTDPLLSRYSVVVVDEAHERSVSTDVLLGLLKRIQKKRPELRIVISSATLQAEAFAQFFAMNDAEAPEHTAESVNQSIISIQGRSFPVDIMYLTIPAENYVQKAVETVLRIFEREPEAGDILVFLTGREEVDAAVQLITDYITDHPTEGSEKMLVPHPLYAGLSKERQMAIFEPAVQDVQKVIVSTNVAETSITLEEVSFVIDCGLVKQRVYDTRTNLESLVTTTISKASAIQRAGRSGRTKPGKCYRLYTEEAYLQFEETTTPDIQRIPLTSVLLQLKALGIDNLALFDFITAPPSELVAKGLEMLYALGALDDFAQLTHPIGYAMAELAMEPPMMARALLAAEQFDCLEEMVTVAAIISSGESVWARSDDGGGFRERDEVKVPFTADEGDHLTLLNVYQSFTTIGESSSQFCRKHGLNYAALNKCVYIRQQIKANLQRLRQTRNWPSTTLSPSAATYDKAERIRRCLTVGYFANVAIRNPDDGTFHSLDGSMTFHAHPSSILFKRNASWVLYQEALQSKGKIYLRNMTKIEKKWLLEYAPTYYEQIS